MCANCSHDEKMVCGSNGKTYNDFCQLQKKACESNTILKMAWKGHCRGRFLLLYLSSVCMVIIFDGGERQRKLEM